MKIFRGLLAVGLLTFGVNTADAHEPPGVTYFLFGFPNHAIPVIDGDVSDWAMVPEAFWVTREYDFEETVIGNDTEVNLADFNTKNISGWNDDANRLYTMADVVDDFFKRDKEDPSGVDWDDGFDFVVDADHSGGDLWNGDWHAEEHDDQIDLVFVTGQNYRYYVPPLDGYYIFMLGRGFVGNDNFLTTGRDILRPEHLAVGWSMTGTTTGEPNARVYEMMVTPWENMYRGDDGESRSTIVDLEPGTIIHLAYMYKDFDSAVEGERYSASYDFPPLHDTWRNSTLHADFEALEVDDSLFPTAVETDTWGRIKSDFIVGE
jgi:hypothetical protein